MAVYRQLEKAEQTGDANASWVGLWSRASASNAREDAALSTLRVTSDAVLGVTPRPRFSCRETRRYCSDKWAKANF